MVNDKDGNTALHIAAALGQEEVVGILLERAASLLEIRNRNGRTALMAAAAENHANVASMLLAAGAQTRSSGKTSALHLAAYRGHGARHKLTAEDKPMPDK